MNLWRRRVLRKLAQTPPSGQQGAAPTVPMGNSQPSQPASAFMATLATGWSKAPGAVSQIDVLIRELDAAILAATDKKFNFEKLYSSSFQGIEGTFTPPTSDILNFSKAVFAQFLNNKNPMQTPLAVNDMRQRASIVARADMSKFSQINPTSDLGKKGVSLAKVQALTAGILNSIPAQ
jgi:hypothetical protein